MGRRAELIHVVTAQVRMVLKLRAIRLLASWIEKLLHPCHQHLWRPTQTAASRPPMLSDRLVEMAQNVFTLHISIGKVSYFRLAVARVVRQRFNQCLDGLVPSVTAGSAETRRVWPKLLLLGEDMMVSRAGRETKHMQSTRKEFFT